MRKNMENRTMSQQENQCSMCSYAFWDSDKVCRRCAHYVGYKKECSIDDTTHSPEDYCSSFREL